MKVLSYYGHNVALYILKFPIKLYQLSTCIFRLRNLFKVTMLLYYPGDSYIFMPKVGLRKNITVLRHSVSLFMRSLYGAGYAPSTKSLSKEIREVAIDSSVACLSKQKYVINIFRLTLH